MGLTGEGYRKVRATCWRRTSRGWVGSGGGDGEVGGKFGWEKPQR